MAPFWFRFYQFLVLYIEKISFLKILCYGPEVVGFQTKVILDLWGMTFHAAVIIALVLALLLESISAYCENFMFSRKKSIHIIVVKKITSYFVAQSFVDFG